MLDDGSMATWKKRRTTSIAAWVERAVLRSRGSDHYQFWQVIIERI